MTKSILVSSPQSTYALQGLVREKISGCLKLIIHARAGATCVWQREIGKGPPISRVLVSHLKSAVIPRPGRWRTSEPRLVPPSGAEGARAARHDQTIAKRFCERECAVRRELWRMEMRRRSFGDRFLGKKKKKPTESSFYYEPDLRVSRTAQATHTATPRCPSLPRLFPYHTPSRPR
jgi:hypothetical protein